jgi:hypothetical protein
MTPQKPLFCKAEKGGDQSLKTLPGLPGTNSQQVRPRDAQSVQDRENFSIAPFPEHLGNSGANNCVRPAAEEHFETARGSMRITDYGIGFSDTGSEKQMGGPSCPTARRPRFQIVDQVVNGQY